MSDDDFTLAVARTASAAVETLLRKHQDYGPGNIGNAPGGALNGLRVRIHDKTARINHLLDTGADPENESLRDSFLDLANYALIAMLVLDGAWPETDDRSKVLRAVQHVRRDEYYPEADGTYSEATLRVATVMGRVIEAIEKAG